MHFLRNMRNNTRELVEEAIKLSGRTDIYIHDTPIAPDYSIDSGYHIVKSLMHSHFALCVDEYSRDCSDFWSTYDMLSEQPRWRIFLALSENNNY